MPAIDTSAIGNIGESRVLFELTRLGIQCYLPYCGTGDIDLVANINGILKKIQIKTIIHPNKSGAMEWKTTRQDGFHGKRAPYNHSSIDYFALYCVDTDTVCFVKYEEGFPSFTISIRPDNYPGHRKSGMRFVSDYVAEKVLF